MKTSVRLVHSCCVFDILWMIYCVKCKDYLKKIVKTFLYHLLNVCRPKLPHYATKCNAKPIICAAVITLIGSVELLDILYSSASLYITYLIYSESVSHRGISSGEGISQMAAQFVVDCNPSLQTSHKCQRWWWWCCVCEASTCRNFSFFAAASMSVLVWY